MPAANLTTLFQFEAQISAAAVGVLEAAGYSDIYVRGTNDSVHDTGLMLWVDVGSADPATLGRIGAGPLSGRPEFFGYTATLSLMRVIPRPENTEQATASSLVYEAGKLRSLFLRSALPFTAANLPHLTVTEILPGSAQWGTSEVANLDTLTLSWSLTFQVNPAAWPTS